MEERMIDEEYGRGVRLKRTKDGFVDVTDELCTDEENAAQDGEEIVFQFPDEEPVFEGEGEEYAELSPEEAAALKKKKEEEAAARLAKYQALCQEGDTQLAEGKFEEAENTFAKALDYDDEATAASVGYWRAKTENFAEPDVLIDEYVEAGIQTLEFDLGYEAAAIIKKEYREVFEKKVQELTAEEEPLAEKVYAVQERRREKVHFRMKKSGIAMGISALPTLCCLILAIVFGLKIVSTPENTFVLPTIILGVAFVVCFVIFGTFANKFINDCRMNAKNEDLSETDDGARLLEIQEYKELYLALLETNGEESAKNAETANE